MPFEAIFPRMTMVALGGGFSFLFSAYGLSCLEDIYTRFAKDQIQKEVTELKRKYGVQVMSYPEITVETKNPDIYQVGFLIDHRKCDVFSVLMAVLHKVSDSSDEQATITPGKFTAFKREGIMTYQLEFSEREKSKKAKESKGFVSISGSFILDRPGFRIVLQKNDSLSQTDMDLVLTAYREANIPKDYSSLRSSFIKELSLGQNQNPTQTKSLGKSKVLSYDEAKKQLEELGVVLFEPNGRVQDLDWDCLAGYERQKRDIEDTVLLALTYPDLYDRITSGTRMKAEVNRPKAVLFEGPPGTGKTTSAKIIAQQVNVPLIYLPIESIMSKWYGESEKRFSDIFEAAQSLGRSILFIDEIDALASARSNEMHEASRRILSTLLRKIDSFESASDVLLICATNRKADLDLAMLSRIDLSVQFELPDINSRSAIFKRYAKHLSDSERGSLAQMSTGFSGRNIADICKDAERRWASKLLRKEVQSELPDLAQYQESLRSRVANGLA
jgi:ATPase family associated with various cellular activities (AAA)